MTISEDMRDWCSMNFGSVQPRCYSGMRTRRAGLGFRPRRHCAREVESLPSSKPSEGGTALMGLKNARGEDQPMRCVDRHPEHRPPAERGFKRILGRGQPICGARVRAVTQEFDPR